jgi:hypothetical protein
LTAWNEAKLAAERGKSDPSKGVDDLFEDWALKEPKLSWRIWTFMDATDWKHLPDQGGVLDQDEGIIEDVTLLSYMSSLVRDELKGGPSDG